MAEQQQINAAARRLKYMDTERVQHVMALIMILSFLIFGGLAGLIFLTHTPLTSKSVALPFTFLFLFMNTLITSGRIEDQPQRLDHHLLEWLVISALLMVIAGLVVIFSQ